MHRAHFRFYEELNDFLPQEKRKVKFQIEFKGRPSIKDLIESIGIPHSEIDLILVNGTSVDFKYIVQSGDVISVYPVFESFDISEVTHLRAKPLRTPGFIADVHLGKLARYLRMLGFDVKYNNSYSKKEIIYISLNERRTILTRDRNLLKINEVTHGYWIRNEEPLEQVKEILERFDLKKAIQEFTRCLECNEFLVQVMKENIINQIPPKVKAYHNEFHQCLSCKRIYWQGTHFERMQEILKLLK